MTEAAGGDARAPSTREAILAAAQRLFASLGFRDTMVEMTLDAEEPEAER